MSSEAAQPKIKGRLEKGDGGNFRKRRYFLKINRIEPGKELTSQGQVLNTLKKIKNSDSTGITEILQIG